MTTKEAIQATIECVFSESKEELQDLATQNIMDIMMSSHEIRRRGRWVEHHEPYTWMGYAYWTCSECNYGEDNENGVRSNYCPNCGAEME